MQPPARGGISGGSGNKMQGAGKASVAPVAEPLAPPTKSKPKKKRRVAPTHFLAIRLPSPDLARAGEEVQQACVEASADTRLAVVNVKKLHITLFVLTVEDGADGLALVRDTLAACAADVVAVWGAPARPTVPLLGLGTFGKGGVLYVGVDQKSPGHTLLVQFVNAVHARFVSAGVLDPDHALGFKAHATLLKQSQASRRCRSKADRARVRKMRLRVPVGFGCRSYGVHTIMSVELNAMSTAEDGYYVVVDELPVFHGHPEAADIKAERKEQELALRLKAAELRSAEQASRLRELQKRYSGILRNSVRVGSKK